MARARMTPPQNDRGLPYHVRRPGKIRVSAEHVQLGQDLRVSASSAAPLQLARLAMRLVLAAEGAVLTQLKPVGIVAPVLARDVVAVLALLAGQGDLGPDVSRSHVARLSTRPIIGSRRAGDPGVPDASVVP